MDNHKQVPVMKVLKFIKSTFCNNFLMKKLRSNAKKDIDVMVMGSQPSVYHAVIIIFLEFFAWGLLTTPMMDVLKDTFQGQTFLFNGLIQGIKGFLSFLSAPILGALSDVWGRKTFLLLSVFFTCAPIPLMIISPWSFFAMISLSGSFAVTFSIVFAYVADITDETNRSSAYGLISATFAASLVISPAIGAYMNNTYNLASVVTLATMIGLLDFFFIILFVPESLTKQSASMAKPALTWTQHDVFILFKSVGQDKTLFLFCITVFLSYLPEAGQYTCIFVYLRHVIGFTDDKVAMYIAVVGILSIIAQTSVLTVLFQVIGNKPTIILGLIFQIGQLICFSFGKKEWTMWVAGVLASLSSINYPALSSLVSSMVGENKQGVAQGMITGVRGLCNGLGPALFGLGFHLFNVELDPTANDIYAHRDPSEALSNSTLLTHENNETIIPGPPFLFGTISATLGLFTVFFLPKRINNASTYRSLPQQEGANTITSKLVDGTSQKSSVFLDSGGNDINVELIVSNDSSRSVEKQSIVQHRFDEKYL